MKYSHLLAATLVSLVPTFAEAADQYPFPPPAPGYAAPGTPAPGYVDPGPADPAYGAQAPRQGFFSRMMELERRKNERIRQFFRGGRY